MAFPGRWAPSLGRVSNLYDRSKPIDHQIKCRPLLGGSLSHPAQRFRWLDFDFLRDHPYFLPGFTSSALTSIAVLVGYFVLEEVGLPKYQCPIGFHCLQTLPSKRLARQQSITSLQQSTTSLYTDISPRHSEQLGVKALLASPAMFALCWSGFALSFLAAGFEVIFVLYSYTAVQNGGLGFPVSERCVALYPSD